MNQQPTLTNGFKIETKNIRHNFTPEEIAQLNVDFRQAFENLKAIDVEFDNVKALWKAKVTEAESRMETINCTLNAGFKLVDRRCRVKFDVPNRKKLYFLEDAPEDVDPVLVEEMTTVDFQAELILAESKFECRDEIELFPRADQDFATLIVGRLGKSWFSAIRASVGSNKLDERLDSEQKSFKKRNVCVESACGRFSRWILDSLGKDAAKGFADGLKAVVEANKEREE